MIFKYYFRYWYVVLFALLFTGCTSSSIQPYSNILNKNLTVRLHKDSSNDIRARVDIYSLDKQCQGDYKGTIRFAKEPVKIGIPYNKQTLLSFYFLSSDWLTGKYSINIEALIKPRLGSRYEAKLSYVDSAYELLLYKVNQKTGKRQVIEIVNVNACQ